jgi:isoleucyl-tRNA synthetase
MESARHKGVVTNPLEARVQLPLESAAKGITPDMAAVFKVSQLALSDRSDKTDASDGAGIRVIPASGMKCARCWLFKEDVGANSAYNDLCARCAAVVSAMEPSAAGA